MALDYLQIDSTTTARRLATTTAKYMRQVEDASMRNYPFLAQLQATGNVTYNNGGAGFTWPVKYRIHRVEGNTGQTSRTPQPTNLFKTAGLDYRGYQATDQIFKREMLSNTGEEAIVKLIDNFVERLKTSMEQVLGTQHLGDGNATGNEKYWHGFESFFGINGTLNITDGTQRSANAADRVGFPADTYASLSTALANYGGENESGYYWPKGRADAQFDFWTPIVANAKSTDYAGSTHTWAGQGDQVMRWCLTKTKRNSTKDGSVNTVLLSSDWHVDFKNLIAQKEQIYNKGRPDSLKGLGFEDVIIFDGTEICADFATQTDVAYGYNARNIELLCMEKSLIVVDSIKDGGLFYDPLTQSWMAIVETLSNLKFKSPRNFFKIANLT